jgi:hypothetical protein
MDPQNLNLTATAFTTVILGILAWVLPLHAYLHIYAVLIRFAVQLPVIKFTFLQYASKPLATYFLGILETRKIYSVDCILSFRYSLHV